MRNNPEILSSKENAAVQYRAQVIIDAYQRAEILRPHFEENRTEDPVAYVENLIGLVTTRYVAPNTGEISEN